MKLVLSCKKPEFKLEANVQELSLLIPQLVKKCSRDLFLEADQVEFVKELRSKQLLFGLNCIVKKGLKYFVLNNSNELVEFRPPNINHLTLKEATVKEVVEFVVEVDDTQLKDLKKDFDEEKVSKEEVKETIKKSVNVKKVTKKATKKKVAKKEVKKDGQ